MYQRKEEGEDQNDRFGDEKGGKRSDKWNGKEKVASGKEEGDDELASHAKTSEKYEDIGGKICALKETEWIVAEREEERREISDWYLKQSSHTQERSGRSLSARRTSRVQVYCGRRWAR